jgi:hypothetical protein
MSAWAPNRTTWRFDVVELVELVEGFVPGGQVGAGDWVEVAAAVVLGGGVFVPDRELSVAGIGGSVGGRPPHLVIRRGDHLLDQRPRDHTSDGEVGVRGQAPLWLDGGEVLHLVPGDPAQVLHEAVQEPGEVDGISSGGPVVVPVRVHGDAGGPVHSPVGGQSDGDEH